MQVSAWTSGSAMASASLIRQLTPLLWKPPTNLQPERHAQLLFLARMRTGSTSYHAYHVLLALPSPARFTA